MGKQMSKGGAFRSRRLRSQVISEPTAVSSPDPPRLAPETTDRAILTLKLQRDELTVYRGRLNSVLRKDDETVNRLLKEGKTERAKVLLKKKRFQEHILQETEKQLNLLLNQASTPAVPATHSEIRRSVDETIDHNSDAIKKLHLLLSLENADLLLQETYEGSKKQSELYQLLHLATQQEQELLESDVNEEMQKLATILGIETTVTPQPEEHEEDTDKIALIAMDASDEGVNGDDNELEELVAQKIERSPPAVGQNKDIVSTEEKSPKEIPSSSLPTVVIDEAVIRNTVSSASELTTAADADDEKSSSSESPSQAPLNQESIVMSGLLPDVPSHSIEMNEDEVDIASEN